MALDLTTDGLHEPADFRDEEFAKRHISLVAEYAQYRVRGLQAERAFSRVFGTHYADSYIFHRCDALEHNVVYRKVFAEMFGHTTLDEMFSAKHAVYEWLSLIGHGATKDAVKATALKELQVLYGLTVVDENGRTRAGKSLAEFYADLKKPLTAEVGELHPAPGSDDAKAFVAAAGKAG